MCRHLARLGGPITLQTLLIDPPYGLLRQSWAPRRQRHGSLNADGFGVGWFSPDRAEPARYRRAVPMWTDASLASFAGVVRSRCVLAAVRSATAGTPRDEAACAPFLLPRGVLLSHNGRVRVGAVAPLVSAGALAAVGSTVDSAFLAALAGAALARGASVDAALVETVQQAAGADPDARLNLLATDGATVVATTWGDTLCWKQTDGAVVVASEPSDDDSGWTDVPDRSLLVLTDTSAGMTVGVTSLEDNA